MAGQNGKKAISRFVLQYQSYTAANNSTGSLSAHLSLAISLSFSMIHTSVVNFFRAAMMHNTVLPLLKERLGSRVHSNTTA